LERQQSLKQRRKKDLSSNVTKRKKRRDASQIKVSLKRSFSSSTNSFVPASAFLTKSLKTEQCRWRNRVDKIRKRGESHGSCSTRPDSSISLLSGTRLSCYSAGEDDALASKDGTDRERYEKMQPERRGKNVRFLSHFIISDPSDKYMMGRRTGFHIHFLLRTKDMDT
jgi:hypothetical protein